MTEFAKYHLDNTTVITILGKETSVESLMRNRFSYIVCKYLPVRFLLYVIKIVITS